MKKNANREGESGKATEQRGWVRTALIPLLCCVLFAMITWVYIINLTDPQASSTCNHIRYEYTGLPAGVTAEQIEPNVKVKLTAGRKALAKCLEHGITLQVDLTGYNGDGVFTPQQSRIRVIYPDGVIEADVSAAFERASFSVSGADA